MRHDPPAEPALIDLRPDGVDDARDLAPRNRRQVGQGQRAHRPPFAQDGVDQVHPAAATAIRAWPGPGRGSWTTS